MFVDYTYYVSGVAEVNNRNEWITHSVLLSCGYRGLAVSWAPRAFLSSCHRPAEATGGGAG